MAQSASSNAFMGDLLFYGTGIIVCCHLSVARRQLSVVYYLVDRNNVAVPVLTDYKHVNLAQAVTVGWIDILFLLLFSIILFSASYVSFLRYDVR